MESARDDEYSIPLAKCARKIERILSKGFLKQ